MPIPKRKADEITKEDTVVEEVEIVKPATAVADTPATEVGANSSKKVDDEVVDATDADDRDDDEDDMGATPSGKRRFFPRVKHLLTREWEQFLAGVLDAMEQAAAPQAAAASHKISNPWYKAFDLVYTGVAQDCSIPHGKNRYHKFKDKIVELWVAIEQHAADDHPLKQRAVEQLEQYRKACAMQTATPKKDSGAATPKPNSIPFKTPNDKNFINRRPYTGSAALKWRLLNEAEVLSGMPEQIKSLVHLRQLSAELGAANKSAVDEKHDKLLETYLKAAPEGKEALYKRSLELALLHRLAQSARETKDIADAYERTVADYLVQSDPSTVTV